MIFTLHRAQKYSTFLSTTTTEPPNTTNFESEDETTTENFLETTTEFDAPETTTIQITTTTTTTKSPKLKKKLKRKRKRKKKQKTCHAQGVWKHSAGFDDWCNLNCNHRPAYCPKSHCKCD